MRNLDETTETMPIQAGGFLVCPAFGLAKRHINIQKIYTETVNIYTFIFKILYKRTA